MRSPPRRRSPNCASSWRDTEGPSVGRSSEKLARDAEQLELAIETLEADQAARLAAASPVVAAAIEAITEAQKPARRRLPERGSVNTAAARSSPIRIWYAPSSIALPHRIRC